MQQVAVDAPLSSRKHIPVLDGVRGIAVLMVVCFHFWVIIGPQGSYSPIGRVAIWGQTGVDLFFVLSGFLITGILLDSKGSDHFLRNFYVRRTLRIFPLFYATLLVFYIVLPLLHLKQWVPWQKSIWFWVYLQTIPATFWPTQIGGPQHLWSLAVEEHFYLLWPLLVLRLSRRHLMYAIGVAIGICLLSRVLLIHYEAYYFTLARLDGLAIGAAIAIFARRPEGLKPYVAPAKYVLFVFAPLLLLSQILLSGQGVYVIQIVKNTLIALIYASAIVIAIGHGFGSAVNKLLSGKILGSVGKYSYAIYVLHPFLLYGLLRLGLPYTVPGLLVYVLLAYLAAFLSWVLFEKWFLRLKRRFEYVPAKNIPPAVLVSQKP